MRKRILSCVLATALTAAPALAEVYIGETVARYDIYCTIDGGYATASNNHIRCGEEIYMKCSYNGTHQGIATVKSIDGETFMAQATASELYNGETVYLYRDPEYDYSSLIGKGTVLAASTEVYRSTGKITKLHVKEGEYVQRGELLYEYIDGETAECAAPADGIITACSLAEGESALNGAQIVQMVSYDEICIAIRVDESMAAALHTGDDAAMTYACDREEMLVPGTVDEISDLPEDGAYTMYIRTETPPPYLGMTVNVRTGT